MPIIYKIDIIAALKKAGITTYDIRRGGLLNESTLTRLRRGQMISLDNIGRVCALLHCQPGDLLEYVEDGDGIKENT